MLMREQSCSQRCKRHLVLSAAAAACSLEHWQHLSQIHSIPMTVQQRQLGAFAASVMIGHKRTEDVMALSST